MTFIITVILWHLFGLFGLLCGALALCAKQKQNKKGPTLKTDYTPVISPNKQKTTKPTPKTVRYICFFLLRLMFRLLQT